MEPREWGGYKQRRDGGVGRDAEHSALASFLLQSYLKHTITLPTAVTIARLAYEGGATHCDLLKLSELGSGGVYLNVALRDLFARMISFPLEAALVMLRLPCNVSGRFKFVDFQMMYPHVLFSVLYHS